MKKYNEKALTLSAYTFLETEYYRMRKEVKAWEKEIEELTRRIEYLKFCIPLNIERMTDFEDSLKLGWKCEKPKGINNESKGKNKKSKTTKNIRNNPRRV